MHIRNDIDCSIFHPNPSATASRSDLIEILWLKCFFNNRYYYIAVCYHPPRPKYKDSQFVQVLTNDIDYINGICDDACIIVAGDFNQLDTTFLQCDHGLVQMVNVPTHCGHIIDKIFLSRPDLYERSPDVFQSALKTKHKAIMLGSDDSGNLPTCKQRTKIKLYDLRQPHIDCLRHSSAPTHGVH